MPLKIFAEKPLHTHEALRASLGSCLESVPSALGWGWGGEEEKSSLEAEECLEVKEMSAWR